MYCWVRKTIPESSYVKHVGYTSSWNVFRYNFYYQNEGNVIVNKKYTFYNILLLFFIIIPMRHVLFSASTYMYFKCVMAICDIKQNRLYLCLANLQRKLFCIIAFCQSTEIFSWLVMNYKKGIIILQRIMLIAYEKDISVSQTSSWAILMTWWTNEMNLTLPPLCPIIYKLYVPI